MSLDNDSTSSIQKTRRMRLLYLGFLAGGMASGQLALARTLTTGTNCSDS
jgi:hypothetical protein